MEGHPRYEDPGATPVPGQIDSSDATRKRVFLLLDRERRSLTAQPRRSWRLRGRYEDLSLVLMLARLERDCLSQPRPHLSGGGHPQVHGDQPGHRLADWAKPWGAAPRIKLETEIGRLDGALTRLGRWLSMRTVARAHSRARERLEAIAAELEERDPQARAVARAQGAATKTPGFERPPQTRVVAIVGLCLLAAGAGAFLLASHTGGGPGDSVGPRGAPEGTRQDPGALEVHTQRGSGQRSRGAGHPASRPPGGPKTQGSARVTSQGAGQSAPVSSEIASPAPQPAPVPQPAPAPAPPSSPSTSTSSQAKSAGGGCPPEFGYEC
jgi:hypothetical protein